MLSRGEWVKIKRICRAQHGIYLQMTKGERDNTNHKNPSHISAMLDGAS